MYTYNIFCFGLQMSTDKELNNFLWELELDLNKKINQKEWCVNFPYHGGQVNGDCYSCVFGHEIIDDDYNPEYVNTIRNVKENDYIIDYNLFIEEFYKELLLVEEVLLEKEYDTTLLERLKNFIKTSKPTFYTVEVSS